MVEVVGRYTGQPKPWSMGSENKSIHPRCLAELQIMVSSYLIPNSHLVGGDWLPWILFSQKYWEFHHPNWRTYIFQRGWKHQPLMFCSLDMLRFHMTIEIHIPSIPVKLSHILSRMCSFFNNDDHFCDGIFRTVLNGAANLGICYHHAARSWYFMMPFMDWQFFATLKMIHPLQKWCSSSWTMRKISFEHLKIAESPKFDSWSSWSSSGWWFGTFFIFPYIGNNHPNWLIFFRGVQTTNQDSWSSWSSYFPSWSSLFNGQNYRQDWMDSWRPLNERVP